MMKDNHLETLEGLSSADTYVHAQDVLDRIDGHIGKARLVAFASGCIRELGPVEILTSATCNSSHLFHLSTHSALFRLTVGGLDRNAFETGS
jgi:hypothetical protein